MSKREKVLVSILPFILAGALWNWITNPAIEEESERSDALDSKRQEYDLLKTKVRRLESLKAKKSRIEKEIEALRGIVPKSADLDILEMDLEKMCLDSRLELIAFQPPEKGKLKKTADETQQLIDRRRRAADLLGKKHQPPKKEAVKRKGADVQRPESGLAEETMQVKVMGYYPGFIEFLRRLESYKRVIKISRITAELPPQFGKTRAHQSDLVDMSFLITAYYLP